MPKVRQLENRGAWKLVPGHICLILDLELVTIQPSCLPCRIKRKSSSHLPGSGSCWETKLEKVQSKHSVHFGEQPQRAGPSKKYRTGGQPGQPAPHLSRQTDRPKEEGRVMTAGWGTARPCGGNGWLSSPGGSRVDGGGLQEQGGYTESLLEGLLGRLCTLEA